MLRDLKSFKKYVFKNSDFMSPDIKIQLILKPSQNKLIDMITNTLPRFWGNGNKYFTENIHFFKFL